MKQYLDELKSIEERFLPADNVEQVDQEKAVPSEGDAPAVDYSVEPIDTDMTEREVDDLTGATPEEVKDAIDMLLAVSRASLGKIKSILEQVEDIGLVLDEGIFEEIDELILDAEALGDLANEVESQDASSEGADEYVVDQEADVPEEVVPGEDMASDEANKDEEPKA
ncbi:MAG: hypothetical protein IPN68_10050 [Bacteroidetes bacterium]|nr:hypothetical protein [Bacteroidota bacterium]